MQTLILLPTYNERENLEPMITMILERKLKVDILVLDDNSPDGTGEIAEQLKAKHDQVDVLHRPQKKGLGRAYVQGFQTAIERGYDKVVTMDCDFSHHPDYLSSLLETAKNYNLVLGSRYVPRGGVAGWGVIRKIISRGGSIYARIILGLPWKDLTGGFKCYSVKALESIGVENICSDGYSFQIETTYRFHRAGYSIKEIPIIFEDRRVGQSKMNMTIVWEAIWMVFKLPGRVSRSMQQKSSSQ